MPAKTPLDSELNALINTANEAAAHSVSASTRNHFSVAVNHLTLTLRSLRANPPPASLNISISDLLLATLPPSIAVFNASFATYKHNHDICRQIIVFLAVLVAVPSSHDPSPAINAALRNLRQAVVQCYFLLAQQGRPEDVRPLLNALLLVAAGTARESNKRSSFTHTIKRLAQPPWAGDVKREDQFVLVLRALLMGWVAAGRTVTHWSAVKFLDIAEGISVALAMKVEKTPDKRRVPDILEGLAELNRPPTFDASEGPQDLVLLAFASGILHSTENVGLPGVDVSLRDFYAQKVIAILARQDASLKSFATRKLLTLFTSDENETLAVVFLVCRATMSKKNQLSTDQVTTLRRVVEILVESAAAMEKQNKNKKEEQALVHRQLLWCVNSYSVMLGKAYARFLAKEGRQAEGVYFLQCLICENPTNGAVERFVATAALECESSAIVAISLVDLVSMIPSRTSGILEAVALKSIPVISRDSQAIMAGCGLLLTLLDTASSETEYGRVEFLLAVARRAIEYRSRHLKTFAKATLEAKEEEQHESFWVLLVKAVQRSIVGAHRNERFVGQCVEFLKVILQSSERSLEQARTVLWQELAAMLLKQYVFAGDSSTEQGRVVQMASVVDVLGECAPNGEVMGACLDGMIEVSKSVSDEQNRLVGVLLLRLMGKCRLKFFEIVVGGVEKFVGEDLERKEKFLGLSRVAVLGTDMLRKHAAVEWLIDFFGDVSGVGEGRRKGMMNRL